MSYCAKDLNYCHGGYDASSCFQTQQKIFLLFMESWLKIKQVRFKEVKMRLRLSEEIWKEGNMYVSYCPEIDITSCGETIEQAKRNLKEAILINIEETKKMGTFRKFLQDAGFDLTQGEDLSLRKRLVAFEPFEMAV